MGIASQRNTFEPEKKEKKSYFHDIVLDDDFYLFFIAGLILSAFKRVAVPIFRSLAAFRS